MHITGETENWTIHILGAIFFGLWQPYSLYGWYYFYSASYGVAEAFMVLNVNSCKIVS